tara:strand:- start:35 stop:619 length:585 start_codon:yes stop_codon:yes gene_type:complete
MNLFSGDESAITDLGPAPFLVSTFTKPKFTFDNETLINNFTSQTEIITKNYVWEDIALTIIDIQNRKQNASNAVYSWLTSIGYEPEQTLTQLSTLFGNLDNKKLSLRLQHIDSEGKPFEEWSFTKPQITSIDFGGELSYDSEEVLRINIGITYVAATYNLIGAAPSETPGELNFTPGPVGQSLVPGEFSPGGII